MSENNKNSRKFRIQAFNEVERLDGKDTKENAETTKGDRECVAMAQKESEKECARGMAATIRICTIIVSHFFF